MGILSAVVCRVQTAVCLFWHAVCKHGRGSVAPWNEQLWACQSTVLTLSPCPHLRPHDSNPVLTDALLPLQPTAQPLTPPPSVLIDQELQEAFQECEKQMASLGILHPTEPSNTMPKTANATEKKTGEVIVNKANELSSLPPIIVQKGHSNGGHGNKSTGADVSTDLEAEAESVSQADTQIVMSGEQLDNGMEYKQQLSPRGEPSSSPPLSAPPNSLDHLTDLACLPASCQAPLQGSQQPDNHNVMDAPCGMNHRSDDSPHRKQHTTGGVKTDQNMIMTYVQTTVINPVNLSATSADKRSFAETHEAIVTTEADILDQTCVGESCVESAKQPLMGIAVLPLTTPTVPEVIENKGERESVGCDSLVREATVAFTESEKAVGDKDLGGIEKRLSDIGGEREREGLLDSLPQLSLICSRGKCSLPFPAKETQAASEKGCSSKMPHNSFETEMKGPGEQTTEILSPAVERETEKEPLRLEAYISTSVLGLLTGPDCQEHIVVGLDRAREGGGGEEVGEKGGLAREHSSFSQPEDSATGVSSTETETHPPTDAAESQLKSQGWTEPIATITDSICTEQDRQEQHGAAISPLPSEQSSSNINGGLKADLNQNLISEETLSSGHTCEESIIETGRNCSEVFLSLISPQPLTTLQQSSVEVTSNNQQVQPESSTTGPRTTENAAEFKTQSNSFSQTMSGEGLCVSDKRSGNNRVHFEDMVKQEGGSSVGLRNMLVTPMDCASLPPLTIRESLHHPVVEASYILPDFLSLKKPGPTKDETAIKISADFPNQEQKDVQLERGDKEVGDIKETTARDQSGNDKSETNTIDIQSVSEAGSNRNTGEQLPPCTAEKNHTDNKECFDILQTAECEGSAIPDCDKLIAEQAPARMTKQEEVKTEEETAGKLYLSEENETKKPHKDSERLVETDRPQESHLISDATVEPAIVEEKEGNQHCLCSSTMLPSDNVACKPLSDVTCQFPVGQLCSSDPDTVTGTASLQTKPCDSSSQPSSQLHQSTAPGLVKLHPTKSSEEYKSKVFSADPTDDESAILDVKASELSISVSEQLSNKPTFVVKPPGPMLSHLEFINDCDVSLPEQPESHSTQDDSATFSGNVNDDKNGEIIETSSTQDMKHNDVNDEINETFKILEDRKDAPEPITAESPAAAQDFQSNDKIMSLNEKNQHYPLQLPSTQLTASETDNVISQFPNELQYIGTEAVTCKASIKDDLINVSPPLSSDLPPNEAYNEINQARQRDNVKEKYKMGDQTFTTLEEEKKQTEPTMHNLKETEESMLQTGNAGTKPQESNGSDKEAVKETGDLELPLRHKMQKTEAPVIDVKEEGELKSGVKSKKEMKTFSLPCADVASNSEPQPALDQSLHQAPAATLEHCSSRDTALDWSVARGQSESTPVPNSFAQQQEQQQQWLGSRHATEEFSGGRLEECEGGEKTHSQISPTQVLFPGIKGVAEGGAGSAGSLCQSGGRDEMTDDNSCSERVIDVKKSNEKGAKPVPEADRVYMPSHLASDLNETGRAAEKNGVSDIEVVTACSGVGEKRQGMDENKSTGLEMDRSDAEFMSSTEVLSDLDGKGQQESDLSFPCQEHHGKPAASQNTAAPVDFSSCKHETSPLGSRVSSQVSKDMPDVHTEVVSSENQVEDIQKKILKGVKKEFSSALVVKNSSHETEEYEFQDTVCESPELQRSNKTTAAQSSPALQTPIKGADVGEVTKDDKAAFDKKKASSQRKGQNEIKVINSEAKENEGLINPQSGSIQASDPRGSGTSHSSTETPGCQTDTDNYIIDEATSVDVIMVPSTDLSKSPEDIAATVLFAISQFDPQEVKSVEKAPSQVSVNAGDMSQSQSPGGTPQEPDTNWIKALREAACLSQTEQQDKVDTPDKCTPSRPLPSLESPQLQFATPTEEIAAPLSHEENPPQTEQPAENKTEISAAELVKKPVDLQEATKKTTELLEETKQVELPDPTQKTVEQPEFTKREAPEPKKEPAELQEAAKKVETPLEPTKNEVELPEATNENLEEVKRQISEQPEDLVEKPTGSPPEEPFKEPAGETPVKDTVQDPPEEQQDSGPPLTEQAQRGDPAPPSLPPHLLDTAEFPTPPPTPPENQTPEAQPTPPASPHHPPPGPDSPPPPPGHQDPHPASAPCHPSVRSSDSDGAFETPESTTPVKAVSPTDPQDQQLTSDDKVGDTSVSDPAPDLTSAHPPSRSLSIVFDENKPIAASGAYNIEVLTAESPSRTLTRSLSLQGGELDSCGPPEGSTTGGFRPHAESFSVGTESAQGTLCRPKKVRSGSLKKKPLPRQNSNPESPRPASSSSTPEIKKQANPQTASPLQVQEEAEGASATPSPGGTLRKTRKSRVETPPPLPEETNHTSREESPVIPTLPLCQEETPLPSSPTVKDSSPIPPSASYKWDPDNFDNIDPFSTGGSKIANSPVLSRKDPVCAPVSIPPESPPPSAGELCDHGPPAPIKEPSTNPEEQPIIAKRQSVRLEFDYSEENGEASHQASAPPKKLGKKPGAKMPLRKPKLGLKKAPPAQVEQLDNDPPATHNGNNVDIPVTTGSYNFEPDKWDDPNFNPFNSKKSISNSPKLSRPSYKFDPNNFDDTIDPFASSNKMANSPPKASASFELPANDCDAENDNDNVGELEDQNQNKPAKKKKTPIKSNTFRVKRSPKKSDQSPDPVPADDTPSLHTQDDHATDEEKLASSSGHKWAALHDMDADLSSEPQDFPQPCDLTSFVNENSLSHEAPVPDYEIEYMEKIGSSSPPLSAKKPSLYLKLDSVSDSLSKNTCSRGSEPSSPCTGSFEEMEAQITAGMKTPVLSSRPGPEGSNGDKGRKRESEAVSRDEKPPSQGLVEAPAPALAMPLLDRLSESDDPLQYLEPDLAETNPTAFALKLQQREVPPSPAESDVSKNFLYTRTTTGYTEGESPHLPRELDHSLGIAREEIVTKEKEVLEWQRKYENSRQEVVEMRRIVAEYEKTIAQMIGEFKDEQKEKSLSHHTIQQLILEKDQALADLNSVEKSLADLFRRYEKMKDVLEGFRKNEEVLKKCAQEYLSRVRKEEQRYQALKIHAEEKLDKANSDIAQVRIKAKQEQAAYQASLRKEQMKVDSLERTLEQKNKEIEELTKICDELIAKMGKS
ncbi:hypothetical protein LDENG_00197260 [Lucifuga dentata]|nr:hypothetical protein LDENG_00197260 [Lucifuga dentata]